MANSNPFFESLRNSSDSSRNKTFKEIFLFHHEIVCFVYLVESPHRGDSNEYTQHAIIVQKIENISLNYCYLLPDLAPWLTLSGSNYPCLEWSQRCSSHWDFTVVSEFYKTQIKASVDRNVLLLWVSLQYICKWIHSQIYSNEILFQMLFIYFTY